MARKRRHHNNDGRRSIKSGNNARKLERIAKNLKIKYLPR